MAGLRRPDDISLDEVLQTRSVRSVYQPIVELDTGAVVAYEACARGPIGSSLERPDALFAAAGSGARLPKLDHACQTAALDGARAAGLAYPFTLFVNVEPAAIGGPFASPLPDQLPAVPGAERHQVIVELTERALTRRPAALLEVISRIRARGWGIALDDVGADPASLALLPLVQPDVIKLDLSLVQDQPSAQVARIVSAVNAEAERSGSTVLAEGIENEEHVAVARSLGATLGQGWFFGRPGPLPGGLPPASAAALPIRTGGDLVGQLSPYELAAERRTPRDARKLLLIEISKHLERRAVESGESAVVLSTFQDAGFFTPATKARYERLAAVSALVGAYGAGMPAVPAPGVRGADIPHGDPLLGEWDIAVVGPHFAATLVARDLGDSGPDRDRRFTFVLSHDRELAIACATSLLSRMPPEPSSDEPHV